MRAHGVRPCIVGGQRKADIAELGQHQSEILGRTVEVLPPVVGINAKCTGGVRHQLPKADRTGMGDGARIVGALNFNIGAIEVQPVRDGDVSLAEAGVACISQPGFLDGGQNVRARHRRTRRYCGNPEFFFLGAALFAEYVQSIRSRAYANAVIVVACEAGLRAGG